ncbi:MAG TPA: hypothetical protein VJT73_07240, partial [Polyangiaceae bacterium]|nr:hypothetical protein [Polyangiaceae bacterium]
GIDVSILLGWRSTAEVVNLWVGPRGGFERARGEANVRPVDGPGGSVGGDFTLRRLYGGGVVGLGLGFRHVHAALELSASFQKVTGSCIGFDVDVNAFTLSPAGGLVVRF